jgi:hypothetical protein
VLVVITWNPAAMSRHWEILRRGAAAAVCIAAVSTAQAPASVPRPDVRVAHLEEFFRHFNCPAPRHIFDYLKAADTYHLDYRLLPAISIRETQCGVTENENNRLGYHPGRQAFPDVETGIHYVARRLAENPLYRGKTLRQKLYTYNPLPAYPGEIERIMRRIE